MNKYLKAALVASLIFTVLAAINVIYLLSTVSAAEIIIGLLVVGGVFFFVSAVNAVYVLYNLGAMLNFFSRAFVEFLYDHLDLKFLRIIVGVGGDAVIEGCDHIKPSPFNIPRILETREKLCAELKAQSKDDKEFRKKLREKSNYGIDAFNRSFAFSSQMIGGGRCGLNSFSVKYSCRKCQDRDYKQGFDSPIMSEELEQSISKSRPPTAIEKTMRNVESAIDAYKKGLKYKFVENVFAVLAAISLLSLVMLFALVGRFPITPEQTLWVLILSAAMGVLAFTTMSTVRAISRLRSTMEFYFFTYKVWLDEHEDVLFSRRLIGVGEETQLLEACPHRSRPHLRAVLMKMGALYSHLQTKYRDDDPIFRELWKEYTDTLFEQSGLNYTFARLGVGIGEDRGVVKFAIVYGCRSCLGKEFNATSCLRGQTGEIGGSPPVAPPSDYQPTVNEPEERGDNDG